MVELEGEVYLTASESARHLSLRREMFYYNVRCQIQAYALPGHRRKHYRKSELVALQKIYVCTNTSKGA